MVCAKVPARGELSTGFALPFHLVVIIGKTAIPPQGCGGGGVEMRYAPGKTQGSNNIHG